MMKGNTRYIIQNVTVVGVSDNVRTILAESRNTDRRTNHCTFVKNIEGVGFRVNGGIGGGKSSCMILLLARYASSYRLQLTNRNYTSDVFH